MIANQHPSVRGWRAFPDLGEYNATASTCSGLESRIDGANEVGIEEKPVVATEGGDDYEDPDRRELGPLRKTRRADSSQFRHAHLKR